LEGRRLARQGKFAEAENSFQTVFKHFPGNDQTTYCMSEMYYLKGDYQKAENILQNLARKGPKEPKWLAGAIYVNLGKVYQARKRNDAAKKMYEKALDTKYIVSDDRNTAKQALREIQKDKG